MESETGGADLVYLVDILDIVGDLVIHYPSTLDNPESREWGWCILECEAYFVVLISICCPIILESREM